ncbi:plasmid partitioning protein RepB [Roseibium sp. TrichSKD4]|nr:plasmid partitioning protein RepB [Roseibium sp. TrichSKD4]
MEKKKNGASVPRTDFPMMGAGRSIMGSIDELTRKADLATSGEAIVDLDTADVDPSFIQDRLDDGEDFEEFVRSIEDKEQQQPALVRPHPQDRARYMLVFGRRRWKAARRLNRKLRAVVKEISDLEHVILQGQENSARANLSYLERAVYAKQLSDRGYDTLTMLAALSCDKSALSKLLSVASIPSDILEHFGAGHGVGRDRFYELKRLLDYPGFSALATKKLSEFADEEPTERLSKLILFLQSQKQRRKSKRKATPRRWTSDDSSIFVQTSGNKRKFSIALNAESGADVSSFGEFISDQLPELYTQYLNQKSSKEE